MKVSFGFRSHLQCKRSAILLNPVVFISFILHPSTSSYIKNDNEHLKGPLHQAIITGEMFTNISSLNIPQVNKENEFPSCTEKEYNMLKPCPNYFNVSQGLDRCLLMSEQSSSFTEAQIKCNSYGEGVYVVEPYTSEESLALWSSILEKHAERPKGAWVGVDRHNGQFRYATNREKPLVKNFIKNDPDETNEKNCVWIPGTRNDGKWDYEDCSTALHFACEYDKNWATIQVKFANITRPPQVGDTFTMVAVITTPELKELTLQLTTFNPTTPLRSYQFFTRGKQEFKTTSLDKPGSLDELSDHDVNTEYITQGTQPEEMCIVKVTVTLYFTKQVLHTGGIEYNWCVQEICRQILYRSAVGESYSIAANLTYYRTPVIMGDPFTVLAVIKGPNITDVNLKMATFKYGLPNSASYQIYKDGKYDFQTKKAIAIYKDWLIKRDVKPESQRDGTTKLTVRLTFLAQPYTGSIKCKWCIQDYCQEIEDKLKVLGGRTDPSFIGIEEFTSYPGVPAHLKTRQNFKCVCRFGKDILTWCRLFLKLQNYKTDMRYIKGNVSTWAITYDPDNARLDVKDDFVSDHGMFVDTFSRMQYELQQGGSYINISLYMLGDVTRLRGATLSCKSGARASKQDPGAFTTNAVTSKPFIIYFPPSRAELEVYWPAEPGVVWAGVPLRARCKAYVGSRYHEETASMEWRFNTKSESYTWRVHFAHNTSGMFHYKNVPDRKECESSAQPVEELGVCVHIVVDPPLNFVDAHRFCRETYNYTLAKIHSKRHFEILKEMISEDGFFVDINDIQTEAQYVTVDGQHTDIPKEYWLPENETVYIWKSSPKRRNCGALFKKGLEMFNCESRLSFICQSHLNAVLSPMNFESDRGNFTTSYIEIWPNVSLVDATLQCSSYPSDLPLPGDVTASDVASDTAEISAFKYGQVVTSFHATEEVEENDIIVILTCDTQVRPDGIMSFRIRYKSIFVFPETWLVDGAKSTVVKTDGSSRNDINVSIVENTKYDEDGHRIVSQMRIFLSGQVNEARVVCFPYDITHPSPVIKSYLNISELHLSHLIDMKNLTRIPFSQVEELFEEKHGRLFKIDDLYDTQNYETHSHKTPNNEGSVTYTLLFIFGFPSILLLAIVPCLPKRTKIIHKRTIWKTVVSEHSVTADPEEDVELHELNKKISSKVDVKDAWQVVKEKDLPQNTGNKQEPLQDTSLDGAQDSKDLNKVEHSIGLDAVEQSQGLEQIEHSQGLEQVEQS